MHPFAMIGPTEGSVSISGSTPTVGLIRSIHKQGPLRPSPNHSKISPTVT